MTQPDHQHSLVETVTSVLSNLVPHPRHCRSFEDDARQYGPLNRRPLGIRSIPLDRIVGSVGRARELDANFRPIRRQHWRQGERYRRIVDAMQAGIVLPPIELYKLDYNYYVLDGNHRVAAAKELTGNDGEIDAVVTQFLPVGDSEAARVFIERRAFEEATGLQTIGAVESGHYPALLAEIEAHRADLAVVKGVAPGLRDTASDWYLNVWLPRAEAIRRAGVKRRWPDKRTADIYCYLRDYQRAAAEKARPLDWEATLALFQAQYGLHRRGRLTRLRQVLLPLSRHDAAARAGGLPLLSDEHDLERDSRG